MAKKTIGAGFRYLWYGVVDANGKFIGSTTTTPTAGDQSGSGMLRLDGARTLPVNIPAPTVDTVSGDDEPMVSFEWDAEDLPNGAFEMAVRNNTFEALIQGTLVETLGTLELGMLDPKDRASQSMCMLLSRRAKSWLSGSEGAKQWENIYIPQCTIKPLYTTVEQRTFGPYQYQINVSKSGRTGWSTISETNHGTTATSFLVIDSDNPLHMKRFTGDNSETVFTLDYPPVSSAKTYLFVNDLRDAAATIAGSEVTAGSTPASAAEIVALYEVAESNLS